MFLKTRLLLGATVGATGLAVAMVGFTKPSSAGPNDAKLIIEGQELTTSLKGPKGGPLETIYSGWRFRKASTQALEMDDFENPAFPLVERGGELWKTVDGDAGKSCASCHGQTAAESMKGVRAQYPKWNAKLGKPRTLEHQINDCRTNNMKAKAWKWEKPELLAMTAYVGLQSRGMPVNVKTDGPMSAWHDKGKKLYYTRVGQLDMSCAQCHEDNAGKMIRADHLSQGQINGFPTYRFKWQGVGSTHRRFKGCMKNIRATPYKVGGDEFTALELYVASRGNGLSVETPAVRN